MSLGSLVVEVSANTAAFSSDMGKVAQIAETSMRRAEQAQKIATAASDKFIASLKYQADTIGMTDAQVLKYKADLLGAGDAAAPLIARIEQLKAAANAANMANGLEKTANEMEHVGFATAGAKRELLVLAHELSQGNYSRFGGSLLVLGERTGAAALLFSALGLSVIAGAGALALFAYEVYKGHEAWDELNKAIKTTGDYTGMTAKQLDDMAAHFVSSSKDITKGQEAITALVATGQIGSDALEGFGRVAVEMAKDNGQSIEDVVKSLAGLADGALQWAEDYNKQHHFMTAAQFELAKSLDDEGKQAEATKVIIDALHDAHKRMSDDGGKDVGALKTWWNEWGVVIDKVKRSINGIGVPDSVNEKLNVQLALLDQIDKAQSHKGDPNYYNDPSLEKQRLAVLANISALRALQDAEKKRAADNAALAKGGDNAIKVSHYLDGGFQDNDARRKSLRDKENKSYNETIADLDKNSKMYEEVTRHHNQNLLDIEGQYRDKVKKERDPDDAEMTKALKNEQYKADTEKKIFSERNANIDFMNKNKLTSDKEFYSAKLEALDDYQKDTLAAYDKELKILMDHDNQDVKEEALTQTKIDALEAKRKALMDDVQQQRTKISLDQSVLAPQKEYNALLEQAAEIQTRQANVEKQIAIDEQLNIISKLQGMELISASRQQEVEQLQAVYEKMKAVALLNPLDKAKQKQTEDFGTALKKTAADADVLGAHLDSLESSALGDYLYNISSKSMTAADAFKSMASSIIKEMLRMESQAMASSISKSSGGSGWLSSLASMAIKFLGGGDLTIDSSVDGQASSTFDDLPTRGGRAIGGPVEANSAYLVGENGPEVLKMGASSGAVVPNSALQGGQSVNITQHIHIDSRSDQQTIQQAMQQAKEAAKSEISQLIQRGSRQFTSPV